MTTTKIKALYTTQLQAGLGMIDTTRTLLELWQPGMDVPSLDRAALASGQFPNVSARRLHNIVSECFAPRYLNRERVPAALLKPLHTALSGQAFAQLLFLYTCRANLLLADFVCQVYWAAYAAGRPVLSSQDSIDFVTRANQEGKTKSPWSVGTIRRMSAYLPGCCADFGLLESGAKRIRRILPFRIEPKVALYLSYDLHFAGHGDNRMIGDPDWALFGLDRIDVLNELKRPAMNSWFIVQAAGDVTRISWQYDSMEAVIDALAKS